MSAKLLYRIVSLSLFIVTNCVQTMLTDDDDDDDDDDADCV